MKSCIVIEFSYAHTHTCTQYSWGDYNSTGNSMVLFGSVVAVLFN